MVRSLKQAVTDPTYLEFFGLARPPFARLSETSQFYQAEQYLLLLEHLARANKRADSLLIICGARGSGKSTLLNHYITSLGQNTTFVAVNETCRSEEQFYSEFLTQIGFTDITGTASELQHITEEFLVYRGKAGDPVLLIIDNAHLVDPKILDQFRQISEIKVNDRRVISVVLAGNADLVRIIDAPAMSQTNFYNQVVFNLRAYTVEETANYVWHRLRLAGSSDSVKVPNDALALIHRYSGGIPQLINRLCNDLLAEAHGLESRVITEKIVRDVANKTRLLPHVIPLHGKGRRSTDPDLEDLQDSAETEEHTATENSKRTQPLMDSAAAKIDPRKLQQHLLALTEQIADLRADKLRALKEISSRNDDINELRDELDSKATEIEELKGSLTSNSGEVAQLNKALSDRITALQAGEKTSEKLAADLEQATRAKEAAENELAEATAAVESLSQQQQELQATVDELKAGLVTAEARAGDTATPEKRAADLDDEAEAEPGEIESLQNELVSLQDELESRTQALAGLEARLEESENENAAAARRLTAQKSPEELQKLENAAEKLAADLAQETRSREAAETELEAATAKADELSQLQQEMQAQISELQAGLDAEVKMAGERVAAVEALEQTTADLNGEIEKKTGELDSLRNELDSRNEFLVDLEKRFEQSQSECELVQLRLLDLKSPKELQAIEEASDKLAQKWKKEKRKRKSARKELAEATATVESLGQLKHEMQVTVGDLEADLKANHTVAEERAVAIEALENTTADLKGEIEAKTGELDSLRDELDSRNRALADLETQLDRSQKECASAERRIAVLKDPKELQELANAADSLAADLDKETREREAAENELAKAADTVESLGQLKQELEATVSDLRADLKSAREAADKQAVEHDAFEKTIAGLKDEIQGIADERAVETEAFEKTIAGLKDEIQGMADERAVGTEAFEKTIADLKAEIEGKAAEFDSLRDELELRNQAAADLETQLAASEKEAAAAHLGAATLKRPEELQEIQETADKLAADLEEETRAREAAENELAKATATVEDLSQLKQELQATVNDLKAEVKVADERAADFEALGKNTVGLKDEIDTKSGELQTLRDELESRNQAVADLETQLEESQQECAAAEGRIVALRTPEELQELENASNERAADLEKEARAREDAERELAEATASVKKLSELNQELQSSVCDLSADLELSGERAVDFDVLKKSVTALEDRVYEKTSELDARNKAFAAIEEKLEESRKQCRVYRRRAMELSDVDDVELQDAATVSPQNAVEHSSLVVRKFEESIRNVRAYLALRKYEPAFYFSLIATYKKLIGLDRTDKQVNDALRAEQAELIEKLLPKASGDAILAYAQLIVDQLSEFQSDGIEPCFTLLIPQANRGIDAFPVFSEKTKERELSILDITLRTHDADRQLPAEDDVWPDLEPILLGLFKAYGEENVSAVLSSHNHGLDRELVCDINNSLYLGILKLRKRDAVKAFRWILSP